MHLPRQFEMGDLDAVAAFVDAVGAADLVTVGADGRPASTLVPSSGSATTSTPTVVASALSSRTSPG